VDYNSCIDLQNKLNSEDTNNSDDFINYSVTDNTSNCTINYRIGQHWMSCVKSNCVETMVKTYEFLPNTFSDINATLSG
jgi:hypothetical protein